MNPTVAKGGRSFKGAFAYYMHDKDASTRNRIAWTDTVNMLTRDPDKAWRVMAYTAKHSERLKEAAGVPATGRKAERPVMAFSLSWHPEQKPTVDHMRETALRSLAILGLAEHEAVFVGHNDTAHDHVHVVVNRIHPVTGKTAGDSYTFRKLSDFALDYAKEHGLTYSPQREENKRQREEGKSTRYMDPKIAEAWANSKDGKSFVAALKEHGFELAQGNKRFVVVDGYGKVHNPTRHLDGVTAKEFRARLAGVDLTVLRDAEIVAKEHTAQHAQRKIEKKELRAKAPELTVAFNRNATEAEKTAVSGPAAKRTRPEKAQTEPQQAERNVERPKPKGIAAPALSEAFTRHASDKSAPAEASHADDGKSGKTESQQGAVGHAPAFLSEERMAERLNAIQSRHLEDRAEIQAGFHSRITKEREDLSRHYRLEEKERRIEALREKLEKPSFWRSLFGLARRDCQELATREMNYENAKGRYDERIQSLENERARTLEQLKITQDREWSVAVRLNEQDGSDRDRETPERNLDLKPRNPRGPATPTLEFGR